MKLSLWNRKHKKSNAMTYRKRNDHLGDQDPSFYWQAAADEQAYQMNGAYQNPEDYREIYGLKAGLNLPKVRVGDGRLTLAIAYIRPGVGELAYATLRDEIQHLTVSGKSRIIMDDPYSLFLVTLSFSSLMLMTGITSGTIKLNFPWLEEVLKQLFNQ